MAILAPGVSLLAGQASGLYRLLITVAVYFPWAIISAWVLVVGVARSADR